MAVYAWRFYRETDTWQNNHVCVRKSSGEGGGTVDACTQRRGNDRIQTRAERAHAFGPARIIT